MLKANSPGRNLGRAIAAAALFGAAQALGACQTASQVLKGRDIRPAKDPTPASADCSQSGPGCHPTDRRQYYDDRTARFYYFDPATGRYYWENGDTRF